MSYLTTTSVVEGMSLNREDMPCNKKSHLQLLESSTYGKIKNEDQSLRGPTARLQCEADIPPIVLKYMNNVVFRVVNLFSLSLVKQGSRG